jgi:hypothetical protein
VGLVKGRADRKDFCCGRDEGEFDRLAGLDCVHKSRHKPESFNLQTGKEVRLMPSPIGLIHFVLQPAGH